MTDLFRHLDFEFGEPGRKPTSPYTIDRSHYIGKHLLWYNNFAAIDKTETEDDEALESLTNSGSIYQHGARKLNGTGNYFYYDDDEYRLDIADKMTFFVDFVWQGSTASNFLFANCDTFGFGYNWGLYYHSPSNGFLAYVKNSGLTAVNTPTGSVTAVTGERFTIVVPYDGSNIRIYNAGKERGSASQTGNVADSANFETSFNYWGSGNNSNPINADYYSAGVLNAALPESIAEDLTLDPYSFLIPEY